MKTLSGMLHPLFKDSRKIAPQFDWSILPPTITGEPSPGRMVPPRVQLFGNWLKCGWIRQISKLLSMSINLASLEDIGGWFPDKVNDDSGFIGENLFTSLAITKLSHHFFYQFMATQFWMLI